MKVKKLMLKLTCSVMSAVLLCSAVPEAFAAAADDVTITNPYANIDWNDINFYKTALHTHTNASDGDQTLRQSLERHCEAGFDAVAITDHGISNKSWSEAFDRSIVHSALALVGRSEGDLDYLGTQGSFANGTTYGIETVNGDDYLKTSDGKNLLRIPYGIENNALSVNAHVNSWFADFTYNGPCDYRMAVRGVDKAGGVSVINHPGEYSDARYELFSEDAYNLQNPAYGYFFQKIYGLVDKYDSCIGIDINSKGDNRTRYDRKLWDLMLTKAAESGKTVYAIATSDAHQVNVIDTGSTTILAKDKTSAALRSAIENGEMLPYSTCIGNVDELSEMANAIYDFYGNTAFYQELARIVAAYRAERAEKAKTSKKSNVGISYEALDRDGYFNRSARTAVTSITVDDRENTISVKSSNALIVRWISDGRLIATTKASDGTIDLDDYRDELGGYVRAEIFGEGGIVYTEPFSINAAEKTEQRFFSVNLGMFDFLIMDINMLFGLMGRGLKNLFS